MGYYTKYSLKIDHTGKPSERCVHPKPKNAKFCPECGLPTMPISLEEKIVAWCKAQDEKPETKMELTYYIDSLIDDEMDGTKWYGHDTEMKKLSAAFPEALFTLSGEGEDSFDLWRSYYKGGKGYTVKAVITYEPFNPEDLK